MYIDVQNLAELKDKHPELDDIRAITANHGEKSEISVLCEVICKLYAKVDSLLPIKSESEIPAKIVTVKK
jgi:hypothetical protein